MHILSICTGMGLLDRAFLDAGHTIVPGCEIDPEMRAMYRELCGEDPIAESLDELIFMLGDHARFDAVIGGPPCQSHTKLRAMRAPKYPDLTQGVRNLLGKVICGAYLFENVARIDIHGAKHLRMNAMHYYQPHQSRSRWFTYAGITPPAKPFQGDVDVLRAYSVVAGRIYGPKRGAWLQGYEKAATLPFPCVQLQKGLANAVPYPLALAWARQLPIAELAAA